MTAMTELVDRQSLALTYALPSAALRAFGVRDLPGGGVRIEYVGPDGRPGRARYRRAKSGVQGSAWESGDLPVIAYRHAMTDNPVHAKGVILLCEGESSCWTLWHCGFAAIGIPGADKVSCLRAGDLGSAQTVVVIEPDGLETYPDGRDAYSGQVLRRLRETGYPGTVKMLYLDAVAKDINALYQAGPATFVPRLQRLLDLAVRE